MKRLMIITLVLLASIKINAQTFRTYADTANYLISQVEIKKSQYIGKPFSVLYDSLKIKPVYAGPNYGGMNLNKEEDFGKTLRFFFNYQYDNFSKTHILIIYWATHPAYNTVYPMFYPKEDRAPIGDIINLYKPLIVKDIILKDYQQDDPVDPHVMLQQK